MKEASSIKTIFTPIEIVYATLSNCENLRSAIDHLESDDNLQAKMEESGFSNIWDNLRSVILTENSISLQMPMIGVVSLTIVEREENKCVKFATKQSPIGATIWLQVLAENEETTKLKLTIDADIPLMLRPMIGEKMKEGVEKLADMLAAIKYQ